MMLWVLSLFITLTPILIPDRCVEPMVAFYRGKSLYQLETYYQRVLTEGVLDIGGCTIGMTQEADVVVPPGILSLVGAVVKADHRQKTVEEWLQTFLETGCVTVAGVMACRGL